MKKNFILGFISGAILFSAIGAIAANITAVPNPFPVTVNGAEKVIEGYNINDSTYFKLRDVADAVGGFSVGFEDNTIVLTTTTAEATPTPAPTPLPTASTSEPLPDVPVHNIDGVDYVDKLEVEEMLDNIGLGNYRFSTTMFFDKTRHDGVVLLENIPYCKDDDLLIPLDYYTLTIVPVINSLR